MLHVTRDAVGLVRRNQRRICTRVNVPVMTTPTRRLRRFTIDGLERFMTTRTGQLTLTVRWLTGSGKDTLDMQCMKLFAAPLLVRLAGLTTEIDLFQSPFLVT